MTYKVPKSTNFAAKSSENQTVKPLSITRPTPSGTKFYQLEHAAFLEMRSQLTPSEKDILLYLRTLDPFGDRKLDLGIREIGRTMALHPSTVSRAMGTLKAKGYIDMEIVSVRVQVRSLGSVGSMPKKVTTSELEDDYVKVTVQNNSNTPKDQATCGKVLLPENDSVVSAQHHGSECNTMDLNATSMILIQHLGVEIQSEKALQTPNTSKTINTFKDQIDQEEYFNFEEVENTLKTIGLKTEKPIKKESKTEILESKEIEPDQIDLKTLNKTQILNNQENQEIDQYQVNKPKIDPDSDLKKFIANTVEAKKGVKLVRPNEYVAKCLEKDREHWQALYQKSLRPQYKRTETQLDFYAVEISISLAFQFNDLEFAIGRFKNYPEMADRLLERHPQWREILTGDG